MSQKSLSTITICVAVVLIVWIESVFIHKLSSPLSVTSPIVPAHDIRSKRLHASR